MKKDRTRMTDAATVVLSRARDAEDSGGIVGIVVAEMRAADGSLRTRTVHNLVTAAGDQVYAARGAGLGSPPAAPTGMKLGNGDTPPTKTGAAAALDEYLSDSNKAFDVGYPTVVAGVATYRVTYEPGEATSVDPIEEAVIVNDSIASDATSPVENTVSRAVLEGIGAKGAGDTLTVTWTHTLLGA